MWNGKVEGGMEKLELGIRNGEYGIRNGAGGIILKRETIKDIPKYSFYSNENRIPRIPNSDFRIPHSDFRIQ
jgi:hypothetical protein